MLVDGPVSYKVATQTWWFWTHLPKSWREPFSWHQDMIQATHSNSGKTLATLSLAFQHDEHVEISWRYLIPIIPLIHMIPYKPWTRRFSTQPGLAGLAGICLLAFQIFRILRFPCLLRGWVTRHAKYAKAQQKHDHYRHQSHLNHITIPGSTAWSAWQIWPPTKPSIPSISDSGCHFIHFRLPPQRCCPLLLLPR